MHGHEVVGWAVDSGVSGSVSPFETPAPNQDSGDPTDPFSWSFKPKPVDPADQDEPLAAPVGVT
jgi:hypothetical protein